MFKSYASETMSFSLRTKVLAGQGQTTCDGSAIPDLRQISDELLNNAYVKGACRKSKSLGDTLRDNHYFLLCLSFADLDYGSSPSFSAP